MSDIFKVLDVEFTPGTLISITEMHGSDASFLITKFMTSTFRQTATGVYFVLLHNPFLHYFHAAVKMGCNLNTLESHGRLVVHDIVTHFTSSSPNRGLVGGKFEEPRRLRNLFLNIKQRISELKEKLPTVAVVIDDLTSLLYLGATPEEVCIFVHSLFGLAVSENISVFVNCHLIYEDKDILKISNFLFSRSDINLKVVPLKTGSSQEVTGSVKVVKRSNSSLTSYTNPTFYHYKTSARDVKVFPPGNIF